MTFAEAFTWFNVTLLLIGAPVVLGFFLKDLKGLLSRLKGD